MILEYNLQFFAKEGPGGEKTEEATPKKIEESRKEGSVAKSKELANGITLLALFITLRFAMNFVGPRLVQLFQKYWGHASGLLLEEFNVRAVVEILFEVSKDVVIIAAPFLVAGFIMAFLANKLQFKWMVTWKPMQPKLNKISPISGFKRLFSSRALFDLLKAVAEVILIGYVAYTVLKKHAGEVYVLFDISIQQSLALLMDIVWELGIKVSLIMLVIGFADFLFQKYKHKQDLKMTKQEVKDEFKNTEGDPQIKGQQKQRMRQASQRRMMASVPEADVVITNPTHFAVALKYDSNEHTAPVVTAKGTDFLANKIKDVAREHGVEIVENKPLARMLYYNVDIDREIPPELYKAVADILAYVYSLKKVS
ncbi:MAG: flagellar biosynthesis protein FlhB [Lachnospiraceae bacterium]|nr:flagellar biosynthesis protein FlhB [Lachnospiraceae bacterium]MBP3507211.1 flagellar biosynthesis protein FlhB [Lachnospiraceae bacterium]